LWNSFISHERKVEMGRATFKSHEAFTLIELLVAISITIVIVVLLSQVFSAAATQWQTADQRTDAFRDARAALQIIARDLGRANVTGAPQMLTLSNNDPTGNYAQEAFAVTPIPNGGQSDLCAVGYYLVWNDTAKAFTLKRLFKDSDATVANLTGPTPDFTTLFSKVTANEEDLAGYVWDLQFAPGVTADPEKPSTFPSTNWRWLEIRFKAMGPTAARKLPGLGTTAATWSDPTSSVYHNAILPYEQQFVTRVKIGQGQ
jgi:type II secretory pathway pseudopilin PulG